MLPILYNSITEGTVPSNYGVGVLSDCITCTVTEERNGSYELAIEYPSDGIHAAEIVPNAFIKAKPNYTDPAQLFRIYKVGKDINGAFTASACHISYDLSGKVIASGTANNIVSACLLLTGAAGAFTVETSKNTVADFKITEPSSVRSWFGGKEGSLLDVYGGGEWHYNNFTAKLWQNRGADRGVTIRYGKNLTELSQEIDVTNLVSGVIPYYKDPDGNVTTGSEVSTGLVGFNKTIAVDFSQDVDVEDPTPILTQLATLASRYIANNNFTTALNNITLDFVQMQGLTERVDLCDTVHIYFEPLGISAALKCIATTWDVLLDRYTETTFGDPKASITDTIRDTSAAAANAQASAETANTNAETAIIRVGEKKRVFTSTPVPPYDVGDLWTDSNNLYYCVTPKDVTITDEVNGASVTFTSPIEANLLRCRVLIPADADGFNSITLTQSWTEDGDPQTATFFIDFGETVTAGGLLNVLTGEFFIEGGDVLQLDSYEILAADAAQTITSDLAGSTLDIEYLIKGFQPEDWDLATNYTTESYVEDAVETATSLITGTAGGYVILNRDVDGHPYEILIADNPDINAATNVLRLNQNGLGFSSTGYNGHFDNAITGSGIVADAITTGNLDALKVNIQHLTATMFEGGKISLGGLNNQSGELELLDESGVVIGELNKGGLKFYGAGDVGARPYVVLNNTDGFKGYDANDNALFWVNRDEFTMKKCVATDEISACGKVRILPMQVIVSGNVTNDGIAFVAIV